MSSAQEKAQNYLSTLDREASTYPCITSHPSITQAGIPKAYAVIGVVALYFFLIIFNLGGQLLTNFAGFVIPGYYSLGALFTENKDDDTQWLTFIFLLWLSLPMFRGAEIIFRSFLAPTLSRYFRAGSPSANLRSKVDAAVHKSD
ncbi:hypothetical protein NQ176_g2833 [Zarea fungicola]|uniref:Uncharacterized protein n=1 Tax=Zarea fungicola TaxID=93591 RepID=A0ACC1NM07_9HYPO|nr:hypothetical protein NQ176_g2833 [Lecanicillium fungicola]